MSLPRPLCTRIPHELEAELEARFLMLDWSPSEGLRAVISEWLALSRHPELEFRDSAAGRRAAIRGGPEVWEVIAVIENGGGGGDGLAVARAHFNWVAAGPIDEAVAYAEANPADIRRIIERNRRLAGGSPS